MDHLVSAQPGLIPQMAGFLVNLRIWGAPIFVDHFSDYIFVALMQGLTLDETLHAKSSFEQHANEEVVTIDSYHANVLQSLAFGKQLKMQIRKLHIALLEHTIRMA
jgi:hypothetical protein